MRVSAVVPVKNEERSIGRLLDALLNQTRRPDEIVVVDGGSSDRTADIVRAYVAGGHAVRLIRTDHAYPGQARNIGVALSKGEVIAFWDGGMVPRPDTLERLVHPILKGTADLVHGRLVTEPAGFADRCFMLALLPAWNAVQNGFRFNAHPIANTALRRSVWEAAGGFPPWRAGEDQAFREKVAACGARIAYEPEAVTVMRPGESFSQLLRKLVVYSRHNLLAGRGRLWHHGLARIYLVTLAVAGLLAVKGLPFGVVFPSLIAFQATARVFRSAWAKRGFLPFSPWSPSVFMGSWLLLLGADLATMAGAIAWLLGDRMSLAPTQFHEPRVLESLPEEGT
jgi:glycosyltransferase involved in cell wall biosynthesis